MKGGKLRIGIAGLGGAGSKLLAWLADVHGGEREGLSLAGAADLRPEVRQAFSAFYGRPAYASVAEMCRNAEIDAVYVATPSHMHCEHSLEAIRQGKHVMCEKPLATRLQDCDRMIAEAKVAGVLLIQGHSKIFDAPVQAMRKIIGTGRLGRVFQADVWNCNDWMQRPRLATELDTAAGGGVVMRQGPPMVDLVRILIGQEPAYVRASAGRHAIGMATEGNFNAFIAFSGGAGATLSFNGYGHLNLSALFAATPLTHTQKPRYTSPVDAVEKYQRFDLGHQANELLAMAQKPSGAITLVSGEHGVLVDSPVGLGLYCDGHHESIPLPPSFGRAAGLIELRDALLDHRPGFPDGPWARTTLQICLAILESAHKNCEIPIL
jgi:phthalate 4,5-cis-dihydrodiol dehydrogenase